MIPNNNQTIKAFTLIELVVAMAIISIFGALSVNFYKSFEEDQEIENQISDIQLYGTLLSTVISTQGDVPLEYCKNISGDWDTNCFTEDSNIDGSDDHVCEGKYNDLDFDVDCDNGCVTIDCADTSCSGNDVYYDFNQLFNDKIGYNYELLSDSFIDSLSYRICPEKSLSGSAVIGKGMESEFETFNPSFTLYYHGNTVYEYNSNP